MYNAKIIYSKIYPDDEPKTNIDVSALLEDERVMSKFQNRFNEMMNSKLVYIPIPERLAKKNEYIQQCIEFSEKYEIDLEIIEAPYKLQATFCFGEGACVNDMLYIFALSDHVQLLSRGCLIERDIGIILEYHTHKRVKC